jgi:hypothetical protein
MPQFEVFAGALHPRTPQIGGFFPHPLSGNKPIYKFVVITQPIEKNARF